MRDEEYAAEQIPAYGSATQPAIAARMRPHLRMTQAGTVCAALSLVLTAVALLLYPDFAGPAQAGTSAGRGWAVVALVCAALMTGICGFNLWGWRRAMAVWRGTRTADLRGVIKASWILHLVSYAVILVALWACIAASAAASFAATSGILLVLALLLMLAAQVLAGVQYVRESGPPGTLPAHMRRLIERANAARLGS